MLKKLDLILMTTGNLSLYVYIGAIVFVRKEGSMSLNNMYIKTFSKIWCTLKNHQNMFDNMPLCVQGKTCSLLIKQYSKITLVGK